MPLMLCYSAWNKTVTLGSVTERCVKLDGRERLLREGGFQRRKLQAGGVEQVVQPLWQESWRNGRRAMLLSIVREAVKMPHWTGP